MLRHLNKLLITGMFILFACGPGDMASKVQAFSLPEAHDQANKTLVNVGEWCSGTVISKDKVATAEHCLPDILQDSEPNAAKLYQPYNYRFFEPVKVTRHVFNKQGDEIGKIEYTAVVYSYSKKFDVAILANTSGLKFSEWVRINTKPVEFGDKVYSIGNPHMEYGAVAQGTIVKPKKKIDAGDGDIYVMMHNASTAPGSSGGGLFNDKGELIALTNWSVPETTYKLATPVINLVRLWNGQIR